MRTNRSTNLEDEHHNLLKVLKQTAEWLLCCYSSNVWNTYGGLSRFSTIIDEILSHGLRNNCDEKYWPFVSDVNSQDNIKSKVLNNDNCYSVQSSQSESPLHRAWLEKSLLEHNLSFKLQKLLQDIHRVYLYYEENAFLRNPACMAALLSCVRAVEQNEPVLLSDLDPTLVPMPLDLCEGPTQHRSNRRELQNIPVANKNNSQNSTRPPNSRTFFRSDSDSASFDRNYSDCAAKNNSSCSDILYKSPTLSRHSKRHRVSNRLSEVHNHQRSSSHPNQNEILNVIFSEDTKIHVQTTGSKSQNIYEGESKKFKSLPAGDSFQLLSPSAIKRTVSCPELLKPILDPRKYQRGIGDGLFGDSKDLQSSSQKSLISKELHSESLYDQNTLSDSNCDSMYGSFSNVDDASVPLSKVDVIGVASVSDIASVGDGSVPWKAQHSRSKSDGIGVLPDRTVPHDDDSLSDPFICLSLPSVLSTDEQQQIKKKSIFEGGAINVPTECFFPRPEPGQTLTSFLSADLNIRAELDRENAHFCISEALISAIEQIKCTKSLKFVEEETESDEEIKKLTQRIRIRRREKLQERALKVPAVLNDRKTDTTTSHSASPMSTSHSSEFGTAESIGSDEESIEDLEISENTKSNLSSVKEGGLSLSMASLYSDADLLKANTNSPIVQEDKKFGIDMNSIHLSAEAVALSLLKRFSEKQLPKASDLEWLVSEQDAPQRLLPLPNSWPVSPDDDDDYDLKKTRLRGNLEWAPPRRQIIFIIHPKPRRKDAIAKQNYRCAGCGMKITQNYAKKFRYCEYLGKYFCQCCHANDLSYIPGRILWKWDFGKYYVSKFAYNLLDQMHCDPLFNVDAINCNLYRKSRQLGLCREYRQQMLFLRDFIKICRNTEQIRKELECLPDHIFCEPHIYSINDLLQVKYGELTKSLSNAVNRCIGHVMKCILCQGKGFICEICNNEKDIIFPFQLVKVSHCDVCGSCFHKKCFKTDFCPKCVRLQKRKKLREQIILLTDDES